MIQEVDFDDVFKGCSVFCEMIVTAEQARRKTVAACQAALTKRGVAVLVVPADVANVGMTGIIGGRRATTPSSTATCCSCSEPISPGAQFYPDKARIIQIDIDPTHIGRRHPVTIGAVGNIKASLEALLPRLQAA